MTMAHRPHAGINYVYSFTICGSHGQASEVNHVNHVNRGVSVAILFRPRAASRAMPLPSLIALLSERSGKGAVQLLEFGNFGLD